MSPVRPDEPETPIVDLRSRMKPVTTVGDFMDRALADPKERRAVEKIADAMRAEQDTGVCKRCGRKAGFDFDDTGELVSQCCGWPGVAADRDPT